jgi:hypothetical protein
MQRKTLSLFSLITLGLVLIGCNRGCTTEKTIASESTTISTSGGDVELTGRVIDYRHSRRRGSGTINRKVSHTYGLSFDIQFGTFIQKEFFSEGVKDLKKVNLPKELKRVNIAVSKDENHIGLGVDGKLVDLIHLYKSHRIQTQQAKLIADGTKNWSSLDINSYPSPASILTESLKKSCSDVYADKDAMYEFCDSSKPSDKIHSLMLDNWPDCVVAKDYLSETRVQDFLKDKTWRKYAETRGKEILNNIDSRSFEFDEIMGFVVALNSKELNTILDSMLIDNWGRNGMIDYTEVLSNRITQNTNPLNEVGCQKVYNQAKSEFMEFERSGRSNNKREASECLQMLSALGDTTTAYNFVQNSFGTNISHFKAYDFLNVVYDDFSVYTDYQQQSIMQKTEASFAHVKDYSRSGFYSAIEDLVDCSMLKRLINKYPKDLEYERIPTRCGS